MPGATRPTRSWLFTPGTWPDRFAKAAEISADVLIIDLEDAVIPDDKPAARETALDFASQRKETANAVAIRINGLDTPAGIAAVDALLASDAAPDYLVLPKTESAGHLQILDRLLTTAKRPTRQVGLIESNRGLAAVEAIAGAMPRLAALVVGAADMAADLGAATAWAPLAYFGSREGQVSKIVARLDGPNTTPRIDTHWIVTEFGAANMKGMSSTERAKALIALAHPEFRDDLTAAARAMHLI